MEILGDGANIAADGASHGLTAGFRIITMYLRNIVATQFSVGFLSREFPFDASPGGVPLLLTLRDFCPDSEFLAGLEPEAELQLNRTQVLSAGCRSETSVARL